MSDLADTIIEGHPRPLEVRTGQDKYFDKAEKIATILEKEAKTRLDGLQAVDGSMALSREDLDNLAHLLRIAIGKGELDVWQISAIKKTGDNMEDTSIDFEKRRTLFDLGVIHGTRSFWAGLMERDGQTELDVFKGRGSGDGDVLVERSSILGMPLFPGVGGVTSTQKEIRVENHVGGVTTLIETSDARVELTVLHITR